MSTVFSIAALLLGSGLLLMAGGLHGLLLPVRGLAEGFSDTSLGMLGAGWLPVLHTLQHLDAALSCRRRAPHGGRQGDGRGGGGGGSGSRG
ncbi:MAG: hypothetical protein ACK40A_14505, partial [Pannonibacter indicus]